MESLCINKHVNYNSYIYKMLGIALDCFRISYGNYEHEDLGIERRYLEVNLFVADGCWWYDGDEERFFMTERTAEIVFVSVLRSPEASRLSVLMDFVLTNKSVGESILKLINIIRKHNFPKTDSPKWGL